MSEKNRLKAKMSEKNRLNLFFKNFSKNVKNTFKITINSKSVWNRLKAYESVQKRMKVLKSVWNRLKAYKIV